MSNVEFTLKYEDVLLERPELVALIEAAIKGSFAGIPVEAVDEAFEGLNKSQEKYFARLLTKIWTKGLKKKALEKARLAREAYDAEMAAAERPVWQILPKKEKAEKSGQPS